ncbi:MAG: ATP-binding cassette domain-containing protein [Firmicutes bacterium]|nr:ATP-binding cassette domain-containing protein [Bacillota bacterium]
METFSIKNLTFTYPNKELPALNDVSFAIGMGEFVVICGQSGSGKSTLLRNLKPILAPHGKKQGEILFYGQEVDTLDHKTQAARIGYVLQNPDSQIVTDKVWHELAFGLESLGMDTKTIRLRVAEMASFFGIQTWFHKDVNHLSGGQKQLLNLASVMAMQPDVLILDEPTSQLDPIAASDFLETVKKINRELGTTVIITEHRLEDVIPMADKAIVLDKGRVIADDTPANVGAILAQMNHPMFMGMPTPLQAYSILYQGGIGRELECPVNVRDGRNWLTELLRGRELMQTELPADEERKHTEAPVIEMKDVWFKYERQGNDVIKDLSFKVYPGEMFCIVGGNGTGKTTTLTLAGGMKKPYRGSIKIKGCPVDKYKNNELFKGILGMLPQNPQSLFVEKTVFLDLMESLEGEPFTKEEKEQKIIDIAKLVKIDHLMDMHPYDLSGGEQQRTALAKVLLMEPEILFLDEPTKGLDNEFKLKLSNILNELRAKGVTIVMVSHDVEFCGRYGDRCAMFFDGKIITTNAPRTFFSGNSFYTTAANRMSRHIFTNAVNVDDIVELVRANFGVETPENDGGNEPDDEPELNEPNETRGDGGNATESKEIISMCMARNTVEPIKCEAGEVSVKPRKHRNQTMLEIVMVILACATIYVGLFVCEQRQYVAVSLLMVVYAMVPFMVGFERRKPKAREIVIIAVLIAVAVVGRAAFFMIPNFKPIVAIVIISGVALGRESGFLIGAMAAFVSNFLFGQGPWTPWQMMAMAVIGYLAGLIFHKYSDNIKMIPLLIFGALSTFFIYGAIVDLWTILFMSESITWKTVIAVYAGATYFNLIHASATVVFILLLARPMIEKLDRVKVKYGMTVYSVT